MFNSRNSIVYYTWAWSELVCSKSWNRLPELFPSLLQWQKHLHHGHQKEQIFLLFHKLMVRSFASLSKMESSRIGYSAIIKVNQIEENPSYSGNTVTTKQRASKGVFQQNSQRWVNGWIYYMYHTSLLSLAHWKTIILVRSLHGIILFHLHVVWERHIL